MNRPSPTASSGSDTVGSDPAAPPSPNANADHGPGADPSACANADHGPGADPDGCANADHGSDLNSSAHRGPSTNLASDPAPAPAANVPNAGAIPSPQQTQLSAGSLLNERGQLAQAGWATQLVREYNRQQVGAAKWRIKEWDYYLIYDGEFAVALTLSDMGYIGLISPSLLDFSAPRYTTKSQLAVMPMGKFQMPPSSAAGTSAYQSKTSNFRFEVLEGGERRIEVRFDNFENGQPLELQLRLTRPPADSMVIATPWAEDPSAFYYNQKIIGLWAEGQVRVGDFCHQFSPLGSGGAALSGPAFGLLDWGRGVWTRDNTWRWSAAQGLQNGQVFGFNLGYGFGDTSAASENMLFVNGRATKLGRVDFGVPEAAGQEGAKRLASRYRLMEPWHFTDDEGRLDLRFTPLLDRSDWMDYRLVLTDQHQVFGHFNGWVVPDGADGAPGERFPVTDLLGFAEVVHNVY